MAGGFLLCTTSRQLRTRPVLFFLSRRSPQTCQTRVDSKDKGKTFDEFPAAAAAAAQLFAVNTVCLLDGRGDLGVQEQT